MANAFAPNAEAAPQNDNSARFLMSCLAIAEDARSAGRRAFSERFSSLTVMPSMGRVRS
jgi:hypothetical protein